MQGSDATGVKVYAVASDVVPMLLPTCEYFDVEYTCSLSTFPGGTAPGADGKIQCGQADILLHTVDAVRRSRRQPDGRRHRHLLRL